LLLDVFSVKSDDMAVWFGFIVSISKSSSRMA